LTFDLPTSKLNHPLTGFKRNVSVTFELITLLCRQVSRVYVWDGRTERADTDRQTATLNVLGGQELDNARI